jgi:hypothetical protein
MASTDYLWQRGNQWYLKLAIPRPMQHLFPSSTGKPKSKIVEPLGDSPSVARDEARWRVARYTEIFSQIKLGILTTPQDVAKAMRDGVEPDRALWPGFDEAMRHMRLSPRQIELLRRRNEQIARRFELFGEHGIEGLRLPLDADAPTAAAPAATVTAPTATGETVNQAAEAWFAELARDKSLRGTTLDGHKLRVRAFVDKVGDLPLTNVTRAVASDFLDALDVSVRTRNAYAHTLKCVFKSAGRRGRFSIAEEANPFHEQRTKATGSSYQPFTVTELQTLFDAMPREVRPKKHTPETALPWVALMALYTGMRLEEVAQLTTADVREETANGARVWCIDVHNGGDNKLKNETSARLIPVHSELVRLGLLDYIRR